MEAQSDTDMDSMTVDDLSEWLKSKGIPSEFCAKFKREYKGNYNYVLWKIVNYL